VPAAKLGPVAGRRASRYPHLRWAIPEFTITRGALGSSGSVMACRVTSEMTSGGKKPASSNSEGRPTACWPDSTLMTQKDALDMPTATKA
jgi:hypothetical protein